MKKMIKMAGISEEERVMLKRLESESLRALVIRSNLKKSEERLEI